MVLPECRLAEVGVEMCSRDPLDANGGKTIKVDEGPQAREQAEQWATPSEGAGEGALS